MTIFKLAASVALLPFLATADDTNSGIMSTDATTDQDTFNTSERIVVTNQAMGARCAVAADFDGDGLMDLVSASSNDNAVSWFRNEGLSPSGQPSFSIKKKITWSSLGSRIVTTADLDGDGDIDVIGASYYDSSLRWFENDGTGSFTTHVISSAVNEGQGVTVADLDNDGDPDVATASSGDNTIAVFKNIDKGMFCEIKEVVDDNAIGARTVVAADLNGDGWIDLASASKDDSTVAWYPNDGTGHFQTKIVISSGAESTGAYSLVAADVDKDGDEDLIVASNGNDHVSLWRNDGQGNFIKTLIYDNADFVLSVTAVDFDRDGDIDVASASFFDGYIRWYENVDGEGYEWRNHTIYVGTQGHYVSHADMDGDGDDDLIAVTHAENTVAVFLAETGCESDDASEECCHHGTMWNGTSCNPCSFGTYGVGSGLNAQCVECPMDTCTIPGYNFVPATCSGITGCADKEESIAVCSCPENSVKDPSTDTCVVCPEGQTRVDLGLIRDLDTISNYSAWETLQGVCVLPSPKEELNQIDYIVPVGLTLMSLAILLSGLFSWWTFFYRAKRIVRASQPVFLHMICVGTAIMSLAILPIGIDDKKYSEAACDAACMSTPWLLCTGFTISFSALFSKLWRLNQVMKSSWRKVKVSERDVALPFGVLLSLNFLLLLIWTIVDPLRWSRQPIKEGQDWITYGSCKSDGIVSIICAILLAIIVLGSLILACTQAYMARSISDEFSESRFLSILVICWLQVLVVGGPLLFIVDKNPTPSYFLKTALIFVLSTSLLLLVFIPKVLQKDKKVNRRITVSGIGNISNGSLSGSMAVTGNRRDSMNSMTGSEAENSFHDDPSNRDIYQHQKSINGDQGIRITSPQFEIDDLKAKIQRLRCENLALKERNCELESLKKEGPPEKNGVEKPDTAERKSSSVRFERP